MSNYGNPRWEPRHEKKNPREKKRWNAPTVFPIDLRTKFSKSNLFLYRFKTNPLLCLLEILVNKLPFQNRNTAGNIKPVGVFPKDSMPCEMIHRPTGPRRMYNAGSSNLLSETAICSAWNHWRTTIAVSSEHKQCREVMRFTHGFTIALPVFVHPPKKRNRWEVNRKPLKRGMSIIETQPSSCRGYWYSSIFRRGIIYDPTWETAYDFSPISSEVVMYHWIWRLAAPDGAKHCRKTIKRPFWVETNTLFVLSLVILLRTIMSLVWFRPAICHNQDQSCWST